MIDSIVDPMKICEDVEFIRLIQQMHNATKRNYVQRVVEFDKATCATTKKFDFEYWDGERQYGYGGYHYDGRWLPVAQKLITHLTKSGSKLLDIGCGKDTYYMNLRINTRYRGRRSRYIWICNKCQRRG